MGVVQNQPETGIPGRARIYHAEMTILVKRRRLCTTPTISETTRQSDRFRVELP
jgi:hypothetical protein